MGKFSKNAQVVAAKALPTPKDVTFNETMCHFAMTGDLGIRLTRRSEHLAKSPLYVMDTFKRVHDNTKVLPKLIRVFERPAYSAEAHGADKGAKERFWDLVERPMVLAEFR